MSLETPGTIVRVGDRLGTVVYNGLDGVGIKWGVHHVTESMLAGTYGNLFEATIDTDGWPWRPDAILRSPWDGCERCGWTREQCIGYPDDWAVTVDGLEPEVRP